jgi:hypothetical protein
MTAVDFGDGLRATIAYHELQLRRNEVAKWARVIKLSGAKAE